LFPVVSLPAGTRLRYYLHRSLAQHLGMFRQSATAAVATEFL
jgi:hypothetical protein